MTKTEIVADPIAAIVSGDLTQFNAANFGLSAEGFMLLAAKEANIASLTEVSEANVASLAEVSGKLDLIASPPPLFDKLLTIDATGAAVTVTLPADSLKHQASITNATGALTADGVLLPDGVQFDRGFAGSFATYPEATIIFPLGSIGVVSYTALSDLGAIVAV